LRIPLYYNTKKPIWQGGRSKYTKKSFKNICNLARSVL